MFGVALLSFTPWIFAVWQASKINSNLTQNIGWISKPTLPVIFQFAFDVFEPFYFQQSSDETTSNFFITVPLLLIIASAKFFYLNDWKNEPEKHLSYLIAMLISIPLLLAFFLSWLSPVSIWGTRHLIIVFAPVLILSAKFLAEIKIERVRNASLALVFLLYSAAFIVQIKTEQPKFLWCVWADLAQKIDTNQPQKIYVFEDLTAYQFWYELKGKDEKIQIVKINNLEGMKEDKAYFLPRGFDAVKTVNDFAEQKFQIAFAAQNWDESQSPLKNLKANGYKIGEPNIIEVHGLKAFLVEAEKEK
jgi:hypothetical protein